MDLSTKSVSELRTLQVEITQELKKREAHEVNEARAKILAIAQSVGMPVGELMNGSAGARVKAAKGPKKEVPVKYRNPADASQEWTGRGRKPLWVTALLAEGKSLVDLGG
jgi:DNA-binding protein H-NS